MEADNTLKVGDLVSLKSGGPLMTVDNISPSKNKIDVLWFNSAGELKRDTLYIYVLTREAPEQKEGMSLHLSQP